MNFSIESNYNIWLEGTINRWVWKELQKSKETTLLVYNVFSNNAINFYKTPDKNLKGR